MTKENKRKNTNVNMINKNANNHSARPNNSKYTYYIIKAQKRNSKNYNYLAHRKIDRRRTIYLDQAKRRTTKPHLHIKFEEKQGHANAQNVHKKKNKR